MTKNRIFYAILVLCLFLFYVYCNSYIALYLLQLVIAATAASGVLAFAASRELTVDVSRSGSAFDPVKRRAEFCAVIKNGSSLPIPIVGFTAEIRDASESGVIRRKFRTSAAASDRRRIYISLDAPYAALIEATIKKIRVCDGFGVFSFPIKQKEAQLRLLVTPSSQSNVESYKPTRRHIPDSDVYSDTQKGDDRSQVFELRDYREGDDLRNVHWGLSSKHDTLIVKEFSKPIEESCTVLIESSLGVGGDPETIKRRTDRVMSAFIALMSQLVTEGQPTEVYFYSPVSERLCVFDVRKYEDTAAVMKAFLSEKLPCKPLLSFEAFTELKGGAQSFYYIYDSTAASPEKGELHDNITLIDSASDMTGKPSA